MDKSTKKATLAGDGIWRNLRYVYFKFEAQGSREKLREVE
jgi:hypothetical protein